MLYFTVCSDAKFRPMLIKCLRKGNRWHDKEWCIYLLTLAHWQEVNFKSHHFRHIKWVHKGPSDILDLIIDFVRNVFYCLPLYFKVQNGCIWKMGITHYQQGHGVHEVHALPLVLTNKNVSELPRPRDASTYKSQNPNSGLMT